MQHVTSLEICAGAGGQAFGMEAAGFEHEAVVEIDSAACATLRDNRPHWNVIEGDVRDVNGRAYRGIDLIAGGVPCPPFSVAGKQLGSEDERDLFPAALAIIEAANPKAVVLENVPGLSTAKFADYREGVKKRLIKLGYVVDWQRLNANNFGVPQLRPRFVLVALKPKVADCFAWPRVQGHTPSVGETLYDLMASRGWRGAARWAENANGIAPTIVGGSKKHGGADLGPTRAKQAWEKFGVDGHGIADLPPDASFPFTGMPKLTVRMAARLQGFPDSWNIVGKKTSAYRQVGNAFPPPVAQAIGMAVRDAVLGKKPERRDDLSDLPLMRRA
jgi:DNA (cytosine-5)-methyltransferase 1